MENGHEWSWKVLENAHENVPESYILDRVLKPVIADAVHWRYSIFFRAMVRSRSLSWSWSWTLSGCVSCAQPIIWWAWPSPQPSCLALEQRKGNHPCTSPYLDIVSYTDGCLHCARDIIYQVSISLMLWFSYSKTLLYRTHLTWNSGEFEVRRWSPPTLLMDEEGAERRRPLTNQPLRDEQRSITTTWILWPVTIVNSLLGTRRCRIYWGMIRSWLSFGDTRPLMNP